MKTIVALVISIFLLLNDLFSFLFSLIQELIVSLKAIFSIIAIAMAGGAVDYIAHLKETGETLKMKKLLGHSLIAGFAGYMTSQLCIYFKLDPNISSFLIGVSGFAGVRSLKFFENLTKRIVSKISRIKFDENEKHNKDDTDSNSD